MLVFLHKRSGVSTIIATLLMIAVTVAASVITYSWVISMVNYQSIQSRTQIRIENVVWIDSNHYVVEVRNTGSVAADIKDVAIEKNMGGDILESDSVPLTIPVNSGTLINVTLNKIIILPRTDYTIRVTTSTGFYYEFSTSSETIS